VTKTLIQILAIARTEFRFALRRGAPVVVTAFVGLLVGAGILINPFLNLKDWSPTDRDLSPQTLEMLAANGVTVQEYTDLSRNLLAEMTIELTPSTWFLTLLAPLLLPVATALVVPGDRQFGMLELLRSSPITGEVYLAGKMLGALSTVLLFALIPFSLFLAVYEIATLAVIRSGMPLFMVDFYLRLSLMDALPMFVWGALLGVAAGTPFHSRKAAILPGFGIGFLGLLLWVWAFGFPSTPFGFADVAAYYVYQGYHSVAQVTMAKLFGNAIPPTVGMLGEGAPVIGFERVLGMYLVLLAVLAAATALARLWLKWREDF
jgi:ABC-type transport system involved in multi-copper enzyme maturation permease subunit